MSTPIRDACERVIEATQDGVIFIDAGATIVWWNAAAGQIFGYTSEQVVGRLVTMLMPEPYASEHAGYIARYERTRVPHAIGSIRQVMGRRSDGSRFPLEVSVTEVDDNSVRYAAILRDISERARTEQQLVHKNRMAAAGGLASMFIHEVSNPLNNMFIHAQMLERKVTKLASRPVPAEQVDLKATLGEGLGVVMDEMRRLSHLLHEFRELYQHTPTLSPINVVVLLRDMVRRHVVEPGLVNIELIEEIEPGLPPVVGNVDKLEQVLANLGKNAIEAMPSGGMLRVRATRLDRKVIIEISDTGAGIAGDIDPFEAFHTTKPGSSGLGLPVVRQIVLDHGGDVTFVSEPGRGTTFRVELRTAV
jgi:two-component system, LuxR family, sensor kinase FixL